MTSCRLRQTSLIILITFCGMDLNAFSKEPQKRGIGLSQADPFELMIEKIPGFEERVTTCQKPERGVGFNECLWDGDPRLDLNALPEKEKKAISGYLEFKKDGYYDEAPEVGDTPLQMTEHITTDKDPAIESLELYFSKKLSQALYGDVKKDLVGNVGKKLDKKKHKVVDHRVFHDIYENLVSKKVVADISSYCIRVDYSIFDKENGSPIANGPYVIADPKKSDDTAAVMKRNKERLAEGAERHSKLWKKCFADLAGVCYESDAYCDQFQSRNVKRGCENRIEHSQVKACAVMRSVRAARQALITNKHIMNAYNDSESENHISGSIALQHSNSDQIEVSAYDPNNEEISPDKITTFSSGEILSKENEFSASNQKEIEKMAECYNEETDEIIDSDACENFLNTNRKEQQRAVAEIFVRGKAVSQQIEEMEDEDQVRNFLKEEGRSDDEIDALVEAYDNIEDLRAEINDRYKKQQDALVEEMSALVNQTTAEGEEINPEKDLGTIKKIHRELTQREDTFKQMVHYNNVMASFLTIGNGNNDDEEQMRNTGMVIQEMKNSAFNPEVNKDSNEGADYFNQLTTTLEETKSLEENDSDATNILLDVSKINEVILKYDRQPAAQEENQ